MSFLIYIWTALYVFPTLLHVGALKGEVNRIIGSWNADNWRYPHVVAIYESKFFTADEMKCGGSILTRLSILTACHCLVQKGNRLKTAGDHYAVAGVAVLSNRKSKQIRYFNKFVVHPQCNVVSPPVPSDVGLAFVHKPFVLTKTVKLVKFITSEMSTLWWWYNRFISVEKICHIVGWGLTSYPDGQPAERLQDGRVKLISEQLCDLSVCYYNDICDDAISKRNCTCANSYEGSAVCMGDSGGPLMCNDYIFGIISSSRECEANDGVPNIFCNPLTVLDFVNQQIPYYKVTSHPKRQDPTSRVSSDSYPFVVSIANVTNKYVPVSFCAGSIFTATTVVTTCVCLKNLSYSHEMGRYRDVAVISGTTDLIKDYHYVRKLGIIKVAVNCRENSLTVNDVGIAFVDGEFNFRTPHVQPLKILSDHVPKLRRAIRKFQTTSTKCYIASWGYNIEQPTQIRYNVFSEWQVTLLDPKKCEVGFCVRHREMCDDVSLNNIGLCGVAYNASQSCYADTGGPLICEGHFFGIVSFNGELCAANNNVKITSILSMFQLVKKMRGVVKLYNETTNSLGCDYPNGVFAIFLWNAFFLLVTST